MRKIGPDTPIDNIGFSFRTRNSLRRAHIDTFKDLMDAYEKGEIRRIRSLGKVQYGEILAIIDSLGYRKENKVISNPYIHSRGYHVPREIENIPIDNMNLENRLRNVLYREGYRTVGKIMRMKKESLNLIHGIGDKSIDELMKAVKRIEKEGIEYFTATDRTNEPIKEDDLRTIDKRTAFHLVKEYGLKVKWIAEWYDVSVSWINFAINDKVNHGNWLNREFTEEDAKNLNHMIDSNTITTKQDRNPNSGLIKYSNRKRGKARWRYLLPRECFMLMGFDEKDYEKVVIDNLEYLPGKKLFTNEKMMRMAGNSICVDVLEAIFKQIKELDKLLYKKKRKRCGGTNPL